MWTSTGDEHEVWPKPDMYWCPASWQPQPSECTQCVSVNPVVAARGGGALAVVPSVKLRHRTSEHHSTQHSTQYTVHSSQYSMET